MCSEIHRFPSLFKNNNKVVTNYKQSGADFMKKLVPEQLVVLNANFLLKLVPLQIQTGS